MSIGQRLNHPLNLGDDHLNTFFILAAVGDNYISMALAGFDKFQVHGSDGSQILLDDVIYGAASFQYVALQAIKRRSSGVST